MENRLAENIRSYRKRMGLTQEQLAERLNITLGTVSKWERGSSEPDLSYIMDLAELFRVSVDVMIGFSMRGGDADAEAERIEAQAKHRPAEENLKEYENALMKFPNHFRIVCGTAETLMQIGVVYKRDPEIRRAIELLRHAIGLISQNRDPRINELNLRNEIARAYSVLKEYDKAIEEYKKNNLCGNNDAEIGLILIDNLKKPEEGIEYTERAFLNQALEMITIMSGYLTYYKDTGAAEKLIRATEWVLDYLKSLKENPAEKAYLDKIISLGRLTLAIGRDMAGQEKEAEEDMLTAVRMAAAFDADPVYNLKNMRYVEKSAGETIYDNTGATAVESLKGAMDESQALVSGSFRMKFEKALETALKG